MNITDNPELHYFTLYKSGMLVVSRGGLGVDDDKRVKQKIKREFKIRRGAVRSACIEAWNQRRSKYMHFITVTIPFPISEKNLSAAWNLFLNNLRNNYKVTSYVWVKERQNNSRIHYHILIDRDRVNYQSLQKTWENCIYTISGRQHISHNSVRCRDRFGRPAIIRSIHKVAGYLSKYITKVQTGDSETVEYKKHKPFYKRAWGHSQNIIYKRSIDVYEAFKLLDHITSKLGVEKPFFNVYFLKNFYDLPEYLQKLPP